MASKPNWFDPLITPTPNGVKISLDIYIYADTHGNFTGNGGVNRPFGDAYSMMRHLALMGQKAHHTAEARARKSKLSAPVESDEGSD